MTTTTHDTVTERLTGYGTFESMSGSIRALLFGAMVRRATSVVREYQSDLFHDANWLTEHVTGACEFDFLVRTSGTNIADSARISVSIGAPGGVFYHVRLYVSEQYADRTVNGVPSGMWLADFTEIPLADVK